MNGKMKNLKEKGIMKETRKKLKKKKTNTGDKQRGKAIPLL